MRRIGIAQIRFSTLARMLSGERVSLRPRLAGAEIIGVREASEHGYVQVKIEHPELSPLEIGAEAPRFEVEEEENVNPLDRMEKLLAEIRDRLPGDFIYSKDAKSALRATAEMNDFAAEIRRERDREIAAWLRNLLSSKGRGFIDNHICEEIESLAYRIERGEVES